MRYSYLLIARASPKPLQLQFIWISYKIQPLHHIVFSMHERYRHNAFFFGADDTPLLSVDTHQLDVCASFKLWRGANQTEQKASDMRCRSDRMDSRRRFATTIGDEHDIFGKQGDDGWDIALLKGVHRRAIPLE